ncbi:MAG: hypothetical protein GTN74_00095 [Proteobacteria bacterium]|nr:hypothetical protein [Pseudomonadota bacterium]NIS70157.1 hypothetical protein [Pseudomonadota bacterium]
MSAEKKIVRGGFRATLALLISIIALILAFIAFNRTGGEVDLNAQIRELRARMEKMKQETSERVDRVREETAEALEGISKALKKEESQQ